ncbi:YhaI family protein [Aquibacillus koreensis]|uniref:YhaI family protein n=1 Tax=Aquibacillus koreensis TaxID=279446 RepID=A0A9X3WI18_9BACI|nr:YhaI family protein [Aquibacillus koreensis]MCT2535563.1 YhaI family protein [Aquibacillus koreensis]MDC3420152.1 YhaI family protein [Aquibacillus koreensis]
MGKSAKYEDLQFKVDLLLHICDMKKYPFSKMVIVKELTEKEYKEVMVLIEDLDRSFKEQKEEGLLNFESLLIQFVGLLPEKLHVEKTLQALKEEGYAPSLMKILMEHHQQFTKNS